MKSFQPICPFQTQKIPGHSNGQFSCAIGRAEGSPYKLFCVQCVREGNNTKEFAAKEQEEHERTHPTKKRGTLPNCCGDARNY